MKGKTIESEEVVGMSKTLTVKLGDDYLKVNVWMQKSLIKNKEKEILNEIEKVIDEKIEEAISKFKSYSF